MEGASLEHGALTIAAAWPAGSKQNALTPARIHGGRRHGLSHTPKKNGPEGPWKEAGDPEGRRHEHMDQTVTSCRASATSTESPSWFRTSSPDSGTSPDVLCDTMIFRAINPRQVICEELA